MRPENPRAENSRAENPRPENPRPVNPKPVNPRPENLRPENLRPEDKRPEDKRAEDKRAEDKRSEDRRPEDKRPENLKQENPKPKNPKPEDQKPEHPKPGNQKQEDTKPENPFADPKNRSNSVRQAPGPNPVGPDTARRPKPAPRRVGTGFYQSPPPSSHPQHSGAPVGGRQAYSTRGGNAYSGAKKAAVDKTIDPIYMVPKSHIAWTLFFLWILLVGFVVLPGSFTSDKRKQEGETVEIPLGRSGADGEKLSLTPANTAALVIGFVCVLTGAFGISWLALRWRRNHIFLLNRLYTPLILNSLAGMLGTITSVYTQQAGEWGPQAVATIVVEAVVLGFSILFFFLYNYWLMQRVIDSNEGTTEAGSESIGDKE